MTSTPKLRWRLETHACIKASPILYDGAAFVGNHNGEFFKCRIDDGRVAWKYEGGGEGRCSSASIHGDLVFLATYDGVLHCLDRRSAQVVWKRRLGSKITGDPIVVDGHVVIGTHDGTLHCLEGQSGTEKWTARAEQEITAAAAEACGLLVWGSDDYGLYCTRLDDGKQVWRHETRFWVRADPCISQGVVYAADWTKIIAVRLHNGVRQWEWEADCEVQGSITCVGDDVLAGLFDGRIVSINRHSGELRWSVVTGDAVVACPLSSGGCVICGSYDCHLYCIDQQTGAVLWKIELPDAIASSAAHVGRQLYVGCDDGVLYGFDCDAVGAKQWPTFRGSASGCV